MTISHIQTLLRRCKDHLTSMLCAAFCLIAISMASTGAQAADAAPADMGRILLAQADDASSSGSRQLIYKLGAGDRIRVIVFNEADLSGEFEVDSTGNVALPLIGNTNAAGLTLREFESNVADALREGYLRDPRVNIEVLNFRPFYIIGEVQNGGEYDFVPDMTVLNAVALAGGYTYRADDRRVFITKAGTNDEVEHRVDQGVKVLPGDVIRVPERFF